MSGRMPWIVFSDDKSLYPLVETTFEGLNTLLAASRRCRPAASGT
ncbi:MAG: hypothetical protein ACLVK4_14700 [Alistipes shahii]